MDREFPTQHAKDMTLDMSERQNGATTPPPRGARGSAARFFFFMRVILPRFSCSETSAGECRIPLTTTRDRGNCVTGATACLCIPYPSMRSESEART